MLLRKLAFGLAGVFSVAITGVAHAGEKVMYQEITDNKPDIGVSTTVYLGDRMLEQRRGSYRDCVVPKFDNRQKASIVGWVTVKANVPICKLRSDSKYYTPPYMNWMDANTLDFTLVRKDAGQMEICITQMGGRAGCTKGRTESDYEAGPYFVYSINTFQQTIEYAGRSGDILKFTYSEFTDGFARQAFTREFQVDLSQGNVAAYKGAVIEIQSATNASITYKVMRNFQQ